MMKHDHKIILGGFLGNVVEAYDVSICYMLAATIGQQLMGTDTKSVTLVLGLLFISYLAKPIGAILLGLLSDSFGRKRTLMLSIIIMGFTTTLVGLIPNQSQIGLLAPLLFLALRMIQSMALGSEFLNSASYLVESGPANKRGFRGCWSSAGVKFGFLLALFVVNNTQSLVLFEGLVASWRIPFFIASITTLVGLYVRYKMPESLMFILHYTNTPKPSFKSLSQQSWQFFKQSPCIYRYAFFASFLSVATGFYFYLYLPLYVKQLTRFPLDQLNDCTIASLILVSALIPVMGALSDKFERKILLKIATLGIFLLSYPLMFTIHHGLFWEYCGLQLLLTLPCALYYACCSVYLTELFPLPIRCSALALLYSIAASLGSGLVPLVADYLTHYTDMPNSAALVIMLPACLVLFYLHKLTLVERECHRSFEHTPQQNSYSVEKTY